MGRFVAQNNVSQRQQLSALPWVHCLSDMDRCDDVRGLRVCLCCLQVTPGSPAEQVGLRPTRRNAAGDLLLGDIIQGLDGSAVSSVKDLLEQLDAKKVGDKVVVDVLRGKQQLQLSVQLADRQLGSGTE